MRARAVPLPVLAVVLAVLAAAPTTTPRAGATPVAGAPACPDFPADSYWHADVSSLPVHPRSDQWVASVGTTARLKADFGAGEWDGGPIGIPFTTVGAGQPRVDVTFDYDDESDQVPYPIPPNAPIEGGPASDGDRHVLVVDRDECRLWELYAAYPQPDGSWRAGSGATWDLRSNALRPAGWTSADAAGLPILPGLVRADEVLAGGIDHAIRVTVPRTDRSYIWPARHQAGAAANPALPPMGAWFRLKASVDISAFPPRLQVILRALKRHGMIVADNGSPWFLSGAPDSRWDDDELQGLRAITGSMFEAVDTSSLPVSPDSGQIRSTAPPDPRVAAARVAGSDRIATAIALSKLAHPGGAAAAVVASGDRYADALAAAPLAARLGGPVLLTAGSTVPAALSTELDRLGAASVHVVGGPASVPDAVVAGLAAGGRRTVVRHAGADRYATAAAVTRAAFPSGATAALVASGAGFADALAAGALAATAGRPLLLVEPARVPPATAEALAAMGATDVAVVGGAVAVSEQVRSQLGARRLSGPDRWATAVAVATEAVAAGADGTRLHVATGEAFPDALAAGPAAAARGGVLLLTARGVVPAPLAEWRRQRPPSTLHVAGGSGAVSDAVVLALLPG